MDKKEIKKEVKKEIKKDRTSGLKRLVKSVKKEKKEEKKMEFDKDPYDVLKFVLMTEKSVRQIELQNKLVFIVNRGSDRTEIKNAASVAFNSQIASIKTMIDQTGRKKAFIKFAQPGAAGEIAIRLGII